MPKRTLLLILLLIAAVAGLVALSLNINLAPAPTASTPTPNLAQTTLSLVLVAPEGTGSARTVNVNINSGTNKVTGVQLEFLYDPKVLTNVDIVPSIFFENPVVLLTDVNKKEGRISLALGIPPSQKGVQGAGVVAVLTFNKASKSGETIISFLPKTVVSGEGIVQSVLKTATDLTLDLSK